MTTIWHNPRCSKSRQTLALLKENGIEPTVVLYLETPPDAATIAGVVTALDVSPRDLMRKKEAEYKALGLKDAALSDDALVDAMASHPRLIERPVVLHEGRAAIGRPPESVLDIFADSK